MTRRVLIITAGETPQLVTETLYGLIHAEQPWFPDEVLLATTASGKALFENGGGRFDLPSLLGAKGKLAELCAEFDLPVPQVDFVLATDDAGLTYADVRSECEVDAFAEALHQRVAEITRHPHTQLHLSIAGGRKTMSFIAGQVMSFCARRQDRMSHCLVHPQELESKADFWWPSSHQANLGVRIDLHEFAFLKVAAHLQVNKVFPDGTGWRTGVAKANNSLAADEITLDFERASVRVGETEVRLARGREFGCLALICLAKKRQEVLHKQEMSGSRERFWLNWARCQVLVDLDRWYEGEGAWAAVNPNRMNEAVLRQVKEGMSFQPSDAGWQQHWNDMWQRPKSYAMRKLKKHFPENVWHRVLPAPAGRSQIWTTDFAPEKIDLRLPQGIGLDYFNDE